MNSRLNASTDCYSAACHLVGAGWQIHASTASGELSCSLVKRQRSGSCVRVGQGSLAVDVFEAMRDKGVIHPGARSRTGDAIIQVWQHSDAKVIA